MKKKLQVRAFNHWFWVQGKCKKTGALLMTTSKRRAMGERLNWYMLGLDWAKTHFPSYRFRVAEQLEDPEVEDEQATA